MSADKKCCIPEVISSLISSYSARGCVSVSDELVHDVVEETGFLVAVIK